LSCTFGQQIAGYLSLRVQQLDVRCESKTKDSVFVTVVASIRYRAIGEKATDAFYKLSYTRKQIQSYVSDGGGANGKISALIETMISELRGHLRVIATFEKRVQMKILYAWGFIIKQGSVSLKRLIHVTNGRCSVEHKSHCTNKVEYLAAMHLSLKVQLKFRACNMFVHKKALSDLLAEFVLFLVSYTQIIKALHQVCQAPTRWNKTSFVSVDIEFQLHCPR